MAEVEGSIAINYPWHITQWQQLNNLHTSNRLPHALLVAGEPGVGKTHFALAFAQYLVCEKPDLGRACGHCRQCNFSKQASHPDIKWLIPEQKSKHIRIDQVRALVSDLGHTAQQGGYKVAIISPADAMNTSAANSLLKSLEEATDNTLLMLITDSPGQLLPTIRSRCQRLDFPLPGQESALSWLSGQLPNNALVEQLLIESSGQPLTALAMFQQESLGQHEQLSRDCVALFTGRASAVKIAEQWLNYDLSDCLSWYSKKLTAMIIFCIAGKQQQLDESWTKLAAVSNVKELFWLLDELNQLRDKLNRGANLNHQLVLETLLLDSCEKIHA